VVLAVVAILIGAVLQSATGIGFALVAAPALLATHPAPEAVATVLVLSLALNLLMLFAEGRRPRVLGDRLTPLLIAALPGLVVGAVLLGELSKPPVQVAAGVAIVLAGLLELRQPPRLAASEPSAPLTVAVGGTAGLLAALTTVYGPPILLWLRRLGASPVQIRDSLAAAFLVLNSLGTVAVAILANSDGALEPLTVLVLIAPLLVGHALGRRAFDHISPARFRALSLLVVLAAGLASAAAGLVAIAGG
jgi:uncharacterized protein